MKNKFFIILIYAVLATASIAFAQEESVKGYYDSANDWFVFEYTSPVEGQKKVIYDSANKIDPIVEANVTWDNNTREYIYSFKVSNGSKSKQILSVVVIKHFSSIHDQIAPSEDWNMGEYRTGRADTWEWFNSEGISVGQTQSGFSYKSKGLPSIVDMAFTGERRVRYSGLSADDPHELHIAFSKVFEELESQYPQTKETIKRKTIGPKAPPLDFKPVDFLSSIISMKHEAFSLGWITNQGIEQSLDAKLENAKKKLEQGNTNAAKNILEAFLNEVEAQKDKHLTSEAYGLLKYNVEYLIGRL